MRAPIHHSPLYAAAVGAVCATLLGCGASTQRGPRSIDLTDTGRSSGLSGGTSTLTSREIAQASHVSEIEELFYRIPSLSVRRVAGGAYSVRINGASSLYGGGEPLYVIDGMAAHGDPYLSPLAGLLPTDVTRIEVLRPASASSLYGMRGQNGAIVITTRRMSRGP